MTSNIQSSLSNPTLTSESDSQRRSHRERKNYEDFLVVWLDENIEQTNENKKTINKFRRIINRWEIFDNIDECIDYITDIKNEKVFFILSNIINEYLIPLVNNLAQIVSIYILLTDGYSQSYHNVQNVYTDIKSICKQLHQDTLYFSNSLIGFNFADGILSTTTKSDAQRQKASYIYAQFLIDILLTFDSTEKAKKEMIDFCLKQYSDNAYQQRIINEFGQNYTKDQAIWWYTKDCFIYHLLNKALRIQDMDVLYNMRYYIRHLHETIQQEYGQWVIRNIVFGKAPIQPFSVYRGLTMTTDNFDVLKSKIGGYMSVTSFLSTSKDKSVAMAFAIPYLEVTNHVAVLFEIEVDHEDMETAFGDIQRKSQMPEEEEILFTMGSRFQIQSINLNDRNVWEVKLKLTGKEDEQLRKLAEYMKKDYTYPNPLVKMARLMLEMGKYMQAEQFYRLLLEDDSIITNFNNYSATLNNLGAIYSIVGPKEKAIDCFEKSLDVKLQHLNPQHFLMAYNYNNLANIYHKEGDCEKALSYHNKALECDLNAPFSNESCIASDYSNIASVYQDQGRYSEALTIFEKCFQIHSKIFPKNHPLISTSYHHIAQIYHIQKDYDRAIEYLTKALDIQLVSLPSNHPMLGSTYKSLALVLYDQGKLKEALTYMMMAYENHRISFSFDHSLPMEEWKWINNIKIELGENDLQNPSWTEKINN